MTRPRLQRKTAIVAGLAGITAGLLAGFAPTVADDEPLIVVRFAAGVGDQPAYSALHVAQWQGFFREEGLDLRFVVNPGDLQENLANGLTEFSTGNSVDTLSARARGVDVVALGTTMRSETLGIMSRAGSALAPGETPITTLNDLIGKKVGVTGIVGNRRMLQALLTNNDIPFKSYCGPGALSCVNDDGDPGDDPTVFEADKVNIQIVGGGTPQLLANRSIDAIGDAPWYRVPPFYNKALGVTVGETSTYHRIEFSSLGAPYSYIGTINVGEVWLNTPGNAEIAVKFMKAFTKGLSLARTCPQMAVEIFSDNSIAPDRNGTYENPNDSLAFPEDLDQWTRTSFLSQDAYSLHSGTGQTDPGVWKDQEKFLYDNGIIANHVKWYDAMSNGFTPKGKDVPTFTAPVDCVQAPPA